MGHRPTIEVYEREADRWTAEREPGGSAEAARFAAAAAAVPGGGDGGPCVDLGCGPGWYLGALPRPTIGLDAARAMLEQATARASGAPLVQADLEALPFRPGSLGSAWASRSYVHVSRPAMPLALADLHRGLRVGALVQLGLFAGDRDHDPWPGDDFPGRSFSAWSPEHLADVVTGAGFDVVDLEVDRQGAASGAIVVVARRARTLADTVAPGMRLLVCGLNPSLYAADAGVGYARPGNRFWPAAIEAGIVSVDRNPRHALRHHGVGMTDVVKRAIVAASQLSPAEYRAGMARLARLCAWLRPAAVAFVGLAGWRAAVDRRARPGLQDRRIGGVAAYLLPSTSGLNARVPLGELAAHLAAAAELADAELAATKA